MAQNSQSATSERGTVPGTANPAPLAPALFTAPARRPYVADARRVGGAGGAPELAKAYSLFDQGDLRGARAAARALLGDKAAPEAARSEAQDLIDRTDLDHGPLAAAVAFLILLGLMLMYFATAGK